MEEKSTVYSPVLDIRRTVADNHALTDSQCPLCEAYLVAVNEYDFSLNSCLCCGAHFKFGETDPAKLRESAVLYASEQARTLERQHQELAKLEKIVAAAKIKGLIK